MTVHQSDATTDPQSIVAALQQRLDEALAREAALAEALATRNSEYGERIGQQSATIDVLKVMSVSPGDPLPVFELIANRARAFCEADGAMVTLLEDGMLHLRTHIGATQAASAGYEAYFPCPVDDSTTLGRAVLTCAPVHNPDLLADPGYRMKAITSVNLVRSNAAVPILRGGVPIGAITTGPEVKFPKTWAGRSTVKVTIASARATAPVWSPKTSASAPEGISTATMGEVTALIFAIASAYNPLTGGRKPLPRIASIRTSQPKTSLKAGSPQALKTAKELSPFGSLAKFAAASPRNSEGSANSSSRTSLPA